MTYLWSDHVARSGSPVRQDRHAAAIGMFDDLRARGVETDMLRQLPSATVAALRASGLARILQPVHHGGDAAPLATMIDVLVPIAAACGSTAWALAQYIMHNYMIARWPDAAQARVWGETPDALVAGILIPRLGKAYAVEGGYRLSGRWPLVSGVSTSDWCMLSAMSQGEETPRELYFLVPTAQVTILDTWRSGGLKGSASNDVTVEDLFVEDVMTVGIAALKGAPVVGDAIYSLPVYMTFGLLLAGSALGMAEAMLAEYLGRAAVRTGIMSSRDDAAATIAQRRVGDAIVMLEGAAALLASDADRMTRLAEAGIVPDDGQRTRYRANATFAGQQAWEAAKIIWDLAGSRGVYEPSVIGRAFRDLSVATRHITLNPDVNLLEHGRVALGLPMTNASL